MLDGTSSKLVVCDADNTLWDLDGVFVQEQLVLLEAVERAVGGRTTDPDRQAMVRRLDGELTNSHPAGRFYPKELLVHRLADAVADRSCDLDVTTARTLVARLEQAVEHAVPRLFEGVASGLELLHQHCCLIVVATEGPVERCNRLLGHFGIGRYVTACIEMVKSSHRFRDVRDRYCQQPSVHAFSIGDRIERDILPAKLAGYTTIWCSPRGVAPRALQDTADFTVEDFAQAVRLVTET